MNDRVWMYQLSPSAGAYFIFEGKRVPVSLDAVKRDFKGSRVGPWYISFHYNTAKPGDLLVLKYGGPKPVGIIAVGWIDEVQVTKKNQKRIWFKLHKKATATLLREPISFDWVRANLPKHQGNLVDITPGRLALVRELQGHGVVIKTRVVAPPLIETREPTLSVPEYMFVGVTDARLTTEGRKVLVEHIASERSRKNRSMVLASRGKPYACDACGFAFAENYGRAFADYIEVHHLKPVSNGEQKPKLKDFALLCSNCHAVAHWKCDGAPRSVAALKALVTQRG